MRGAACAPRRHFGGGAAALPLPALRRAAAAAAAARHPELSTPTAPYNEAARCVPEDDPRYRRADMSTEHAHAARFAFAEELARGEAAMDVARASLLISAEDDAIMSHSTVPFPVDAWQGRLQALADEAAAALADAAPASPAAALTVVRTLLFETRGFRASPAGLPQNSIVDHAGTWEVRASRAPLLALRRAFFCISLCFLLSLRGADTSLNTLNPPPPSP